MALQNLHAEFEGLAAILKKELARKGAEQESNDTNMIKNGWESIENVQFNLSKHINKIKGCYYNVMGLPISSLYSNYKEVLNHLLNND